MYVLPVIFILSSGKSIQVMFPHVICLLLAQSQLKCIFIQVDDDDVW